MKQKSKYKYLLGVEGIKSFLSSAIKEAIQTAFEETRVEKIVLSEDAQEITTEFMSANGYNEALEAIKIKQENYLSTNL